MPLGSHVRFGLIYTHVGNDSAVNDRPEPKRSEAHWSELLDHIAWAESIGFESVWLTERHFANYAPSPLVLAAAIATRTSTMRIGTNLLVAPLHHPIRLAEDAATVAVLSHGRFDLGIGQGHRDVDFANLGVSLQHRPSLLEETVAILRQAWTGKPFTFFGRRYTIPVAAAVRPVAHTPPRILIGATTRPGMARAARLADGFLSAFNGHIREFCAVAESVGSGTQIPIFAAQQAIIAEDPAREWHRVQDFAVSHINQNLPADRQLPDAAAAIENKMIALWDGNTAVDSILRLIRRHPAIEDVHFLASAGPGESLDDTRERLQYVADVVVPGVRTALRSIGPTSDGVCW